MDAQLIAYSEGVLSPEVVLRMMDGSFVPEDQRAKRTLFVDYAKEVNELLYKRGDYGYAVFYNKKLNIEAFGRFVEDVLGMQPLSLNQVTPELIDKYVTYRREKLHNTSIEGINKTLVPLVRTLEYAKDNGLLDPKVAMPVIENAYLETKGRHYDPDTIKKEKVRFLTPDQFTALQNYKPSSNSKERTKELLDIFFFSYFSCGLRVSDVITLEWSQVDWAKKRIDKVQVKTKQRGKILPLLSPQAIDILNRWNRFGGIITSQMVNRHFKLIKVRYQIKARNFSTHSLRKTFGRRVVDMAGPNAEMALIKLSEIFNHASPLVTRRYLGLRQEELGEIYEKLLF